MSVLRQAAKQSTQILDSAKCDVCVHYKSLFGGHAILAYKILYARSPLSTVHRPWVRLGKHESYLAVWSGLKGKSDMCNT